MKRGFTLAETLVTLTIMGVLAAILIPTINNAKPNKDRIFYKKALYNVQNGVAAAVEQMPTSSYDGFNPMGLNLYPPNVEAFETPLQVNDRTAVCNKIMNTLNTIKNNCSQLGTTYGNPNIITSDGIRYWSISGDYDTAGPKTIYVDRKLTDREIKNLKNTRGSKYYDASGKTTKGLRILIHKNGKVEVPLYEEGSTTKNSYEYKLIEDSLKVN